ncbi:MAG: hypothetical protein IJ189_10115 [Clostridia bacterium]|nr:hypothetical protein [Clostridia bacterium]
MEHTNQFEYGQPRLHRFDIEGLGFRFNGGCSLLGIHPGWGGGDDLMFLFLGAAPLHDSCSFPLLFD